MGPKYFCFMLIFFLSSINWDKKETNIVKETASKNM